MSNTDRPIEDLHRENERMRRQIASLELDIVRLTRKIANIQGDHLGIQQVISTLETRDKRIRQEDEEQQRISFTALYVASHRLHGALDRQEVLEAIQEIVISLIGSEEFVLFDLARGSDHLRSLRSFGVNPEKYKTVPLSSGFIGEIVKKGKPFIADQCVTEAGEITAVLPLALGSSVLGALVIFRLLPHKSCIQPVDRELIELLGTHAAMALYCTGLLPSARPAG